MARWAFRTGYRHEADEWSADGDKITDEEKLAAIRHVVEDVAPILVEHWHYRGASAPSRMVFDSYDGFVEYLQEHALAGDSIYVWDLGPLARDDNILARGKCPAEDGTVPRKGAY